MKKLLTVSLALMAVLPFSALALDARQAVRIVRNYSQAIACQLEETDYKAVEVRAGDAELGGYGALYVVHWAGDVGCAGGNGTVLDNFTAVEHRGFMSSNPVVVTDYEFPELRLNRVIGFSVSKGVMRIEGLAYGANDEQHRPTQRVVYRIRHDGDRFVMD